MQVSNKSPQQFLHLTWVTGGSTCLVLEYSCPLLFGLNVFSGICTDSQAQGTWIHYFIMKPLHSHLSRTPQNFAGIHISFLPPYCTHTRAVRDELRAKPRNSVLSCTNYKGKLVEVAFIRELWRNDTLLKIFKLKILETGIILYSLWVKNHTLPSFATAFNPALEQAGSCFAVSFLIARIERLLCFCFGFWRVQVPFNRKKLSLPCMHGLSMGWKAYFALLNATAALCL